MPKLLVVTMVQETKPIQSPLNAEFEKFVHETLQKWHVPGMAIAVVDGEQIWAEVSIHPPPK